MLAGGWITDACLETLRGFLIAIGQFVDAHPGEIRSAEGSYLSSGRRGILDRLCGSVRSSSLFMYLWAIECASIQQSGQCGVVEHAEGRSAEQPGAARVIGRRAERLTAECVCFARSNGSRKPFVPSPAFEESARAGQDRDAVFSFADIRLAGHSRPPSFFRRLEEQIHSRPPSLRLRSLVLRA